MAEISRQWGNHVPITYWCAECTAAFQPEYNSGWVGSQDQTRLGFRTDLGRQITRRGVKPRQILQWHYNYYYLYGLVAPVTGTRLVSDKHISYIPIFLKPLQKTISNSGSKCSFASLKVFRGSAAAYLDR